jgi:hypothetical protein
MNDFTPSLQLGVDRYPSVYFVGYGDFNQGEDGKIIGHSPFKQIVRYDRIIYLNLTFKIQNGPID